MRKWGLVVTLFYGLLVLGLFTPLTLFLFSPSAPSASDLKGAYTDLLPWACAGIVMLGEGLLLWLSVDTTQKKLKPRTHILVSALTTGMFLAILTGASVFAIGVGVRGEKFFDSVSGPMTLSAFLIPWLVWGILFYRLCRNSSDPVTRALAWLLRGSVLELLIAVPAHVIVRRRHDCSAPAVTSFGITSGIVIMLVSFGPSVLLLYKKRMEGYTRKTPEAK
jgi:hypothetical protein